MSYSKNVQLFFFILICLRAYSQNNEMVGRYSSNFAWIGMFVDQIELFKDSTFKYIFSGDLQYSASSGTYRVDRHIIYFNYIPKNDTAYFDSVIWVVSQTLPPLKVPEIIPNGIMVVTPAREGPERMYYKNDGLYYMTDKGRIRPKVQYGRLKRKYYLVKRTDS